MTINEFARKIGVSTATVSRAIHGHGRISPATRRMVLERMQELGYTPNLHAQRLVTGSSRIIALDCVGETQILSDLYLVTLARGIQHALHEHGYGLLLNLMESVQEQDTLLRQWVRSRAVDGVILVGRADFDPEMVRPLAGRRTPFVVIGHQIVEGCAHVGSVVVGFENGAQQVARLLDDAGHRRIGYIGSLLPDRVLSAFRAELSARGVCLDEQNVVIAGRTPEDGARAMSSLLSRPDRPTAVFTRTDALALGALREAHRQGLRVPEDLSLVGHDDVPPAAWTDPPLTTVRVDCLEMGRRATETLIALLNHPDAPPPAPTVHTQLVPRESVAKPRLQE